MSVALLARGADRIVGAPCMTGDPDRFFPDETDEEAADAACAECSLCPVLSACLEAALSRTDAQDQYGIVGGTTPGRRRTLRRRKYASRMRKREEEVASWLR